MISELISVIIPIYNQEKYLPRCLDSIINQTFTNLEIICVNDHSTDKSEEIIKEYAEKDERIVYLENPGKGVSDARNFGIENLHGGYVGFVDSDDFIQPQMYEFMLRAITENDCNMVACRYERTKNQEVKLFDYSCRICKLSEFVDLYNFQHMINNEMVISGVWSKLIKKDYLLSHKRFEKYRIGEDTLFCANLWVDENPAYLVDVPLYGYFQNEKSTIYSSDDEIYVDLIKTKLPVYRIYKKYDYIVARYFLFRGFLASIKYKHNEMLKDKKSYRSINKLATKMLIPFILIKGVSLKEKLAYVIKFYLGIDL